MLAILVLAAALFLLITVILYYIAIYNGLIQLLHNIDKSWANINVLLKQRHEEILNLVKVCEGYMRYERETLEKVTAARAACIRAQGIEETGRKERELSGALKNLFALAEGYLELKVNESFLKLGGRISYLENQIADRREFYNYSVNNYNIRISRIPDLWVARSIGMAVKEFFKITEEEKKTN
jgi:LemA protein